MRYLGIMVDMLLIMKSSMFMMIVMSWCGSLDGGGGE